VAKAIADAIAFEYQAELAAARNSGRSSSIEILVKESEQARVRLQTAQTSLANYERALLILKDLEAREIAFAELGRRYLPKHPRMVTAQADVSAFQQKFLNEFSSARNSSIDKEFWESTKSEWNDPSLDKDAQLAIARRLLVSRGNVLESEIKSQTTVFNTMLTRMQESDVNSQNTDSQVEVSQALIPGKPSAPNELQVLGIGSLGGLLFGTLIALVFIRIDNKLYTVAQAERETGLQVLGAVAEIPLPVLNDLVRKKKVNSATIPAARRRWNPHLVFREGISGTTFAEMFRVLRASVSLLGDEKQRKINLFSSALPGEGKTFISSNFALAAAQQGKKTLLIDLDIRKPSLHKMFGVKRDTYPLGSAELLAGNATLEQATCTDTGEENLHVIFAGRRPPSPSVGELLNPTLLSKVLEAASQHYDQIVIDSAPLLAVPDTRLVIPQVDNFCLVVRAEYVPKKAVQRVISLLDNNDCLPSGIVFNGFSEKRRLIGQNYSYGNYQTNRYGKAYKYGYGSYGAYGSDSDD
jgi:capsular exopolysaccharide synthesis family protein